MTREEFDEKLRRVKVDPAMFWEQFHKQKKLKESKLKEFEEAGDFVDNALSWANTDQGHEYWSGVRDELDELPDLPVITCCKWNGHPLYCNCPTKLRYG